MPIVTGTTKMENGQTETRGKSPSKLENIKRKFMNAVKVSHYMSPRHNTLKAIDTLDDNDFSNDVKIVGSKHVQYQYYNDCCRRNSQKKEIDTDDEEMLSNQRELAASQKRQH